jgi:hypothetical protein
MTMAHDELVVRMDSESKILGAYVFSYICC